MIINIHQQYSRELLADKPGLTYALTSGIAQYAGDHLAPFVVTHENVPTMDEHRRQLTGNRPDPDFVYLEANLLVCSLDLLNATFDKLTDMQKAHAATAEEEALEQGASMINQFRLMLLAMKNEHNS